MKTLFGFLAVAGWLLMTSAVQAQETAAPTLLIRLVQASNSGGQGDDAALADVLPVLRNNLRFSVYKLLDSRRHALRHDFSLTLAQQFRIAGIEVAGSELTVQVFRGSEELLRTRLRLRPDRPVILGGFTHGDDVTLILVLKLLSEDIADR
jgi:hypothetical protein